MKRLIVVLGLMLPLTVLAQEMKIGYIDRQALITAMPEYDSAMKQLEDLNLSYTKQAKTLQDEYQKKLQEYQETADTLDAAIRKYKESELVRLGQSIEEFSKSAQENMQKKEQELTTPILEKMDKAIKQVGDANGFTYILGQQMIPYVSSKAQDVLPLVKKVLDIK